MNFFAENVSEHLQMITQNIKSDQIGNLHSGKICILGIIR